MQIVNNVVLPLFGEKRAAWEINTVQGTPDINGLEDVLFHM